ncbi:MAG: metal ABC transporter permease [Planctomycetota bacterium]
MREFIEALTRYPFLQYAVLTGILASVACGIVGTYVVTRRITYIAGGIAHCVLGGMGAARYLQETRGWMWLDPMFGAVAAAVGAAILIGIVSLRARQREDTVIGAVWAIGMAVGILFISQTPGYYEDLMTYLFGNIIMSSGQDLWLIAGLDLVVVAMGTAFYPQLQAVCFDEEFARLRGLNVEFYYLFLLIITALTVVLLTTVVGLVMVIALLTLPVAIAGQAAKKMWQMMAVASILSVLFTVSGIAVSYDFDIPPGATIIMVAGMSYLAAVVLGSVARRLRTNKVSS